MNPIKADPEIMHGTPCFAGTRVPVASLFDHLKHGYNVDYFIYQFPTVNRQHIEEVLEMAERLVAPPPAQRAAG